jgi:homoserine dehydrogenase
MIKVGIIGVGTVGASVANILQENKELIQARSGKEIIPVLGVVKNLNKKRDVNIKLSDSVNDILNSDELDIIVELMGGVKEPFEVVKKALQKGKKVVTANKALLAYHRYDLEKLSTTGFGYEASVAGGIPIIKALKEGLSANHILSLKGIMNGTCNYILTKMMDQGVDYLETLKEAQELGYAEADPTFDVGGFDAAHKLLILASIAYGIDAKPEDILIEGIDKISNEDIAFAKEFGYKIKLLTIAKKDGTNIELRVHPALIKEDEMIAKVDGVMNGISVIGDKVGETMYYGPGAGGDATASAVIADIIDLVRNDSNSAMLGFKKPLENETFTLVPPSQIKTKYYIRMNVEDKPGVLAKIASIFAQEEISINTFLQKESCKNQASLLFSTHTCKESQINETIKKLNGIEFVKTEPVIIRIES